MRQTIALLLCRGSNARGKYLRENHIMNMVGTRVRYQPRIIPLYPELIKLHNNIMIGAGVHLITHDAIFGVLNHMGDGNGRRFSERVGCIEIMDNVFLGYNVTILPNVRIGNNVIVGACSTVAKDLEPNGVYVGSPAKRVGSFDEYVQKYAQTLEGDDRFPIVEHN